MPRTETISTLRVVRQQLRELARAQRSDSAFTKGYRTAIADAVKVITRHLRRAGDGRSALAVSPAVRRSNDHQGA